MPRIWAAPPTVGEQGVAALPAFPAEVIFEEVNDEVGGQVQCRIDEHDGGDHHHGLIVANRAGEHLASRWPFSFPVGAFSFTLAQQMISVTTKIPKQ